MLCHNNRQHKTTLQFALWDQYKILLNTDASSLSPAVLNRKTINLARYQADLSMTYTLNLSVLKAVNWANVKGKTALFLASFVIAMCKYNLEEDHSSQMAIADNNESHDKESDRRFGAVIDRLATSPDFHEVREGLLVFLTQHVKKLPSDLFGSDKTQAKKVKKRIKMAVQVFDRMSVLEGI